MWERFLEILPKIAGQPLAILAYVLVLAAWLIWLLSRIQARTFVAALEQMPEGQKQTFARESGYRYDELANLTRQQRTSLITKRYRIIAYISTLIALLIFVGLLIYGNTQVAKLQERIDQISTARDKLQTVLDEANRTREHLVVGTATVAGQLSVHQDPRVKQSSERLSKLIVSLIDNHPLKSLSQDHAAIVRLAQATVANAEGRYQDALDLIPQEFAQELLDRAVLANQLRADALYGKKQWADSRDQYDGILKARPNNWHAAVRAANCQMFLDNTDDAIKRYNFVLVNLREASESRSVVDVWQVATLTNRGNAYAKEDAYQNAIDDFTTALRLFDDSAHLKDKRFERALVLANRAQTYQRHQRVAEANGDFKAVKVLIEELDSSHAVGEAPDELLAWLTKRDASIKQPGGIHSNMESCFVCHPG